MIHITVDPAARLRTSTYEGVVTEREVIDTYEKLLADPNYDATLNDLADLRAVERLEVSTEVVYRVAGLYEPLDQLGIRRRIAIVAPADHIFGLARMFESVRAGAPEQIAVFRDIDEARAWLAGDASKEE